MVKKEAEEETLMGNGGKEAAGGGDDRGTTVDLISELGTSPDGLSDSEAVSRLERYGYNELIEEKENPVLKFLSHFWGPIPWMIEAAVILSAAVGHWADFGIILALLFMNGIIGFWDEHAAGNAIEALKKSLAHNARARRSGQWRTILARELVPGDIIRVRLGDVVPADSRLLDGDPVEVDQSALTGESLPVERKTGENVYSGSVMTRGEINALVYATGTHTYFGKTGEIVEGTKTTSHFERAVLRIGDYLIVMAIVLVALILMAGLFRQEDLLTNLRFALVLTVAAIPVAMPTVLTVTMAVGTRLLATKQAIVRRLAAVEELAGIDILCSDKTGTLTQNKLKLGDPIILGKAQRDELLICAALASRAEDQDPIDLAVLKGLADAHMMDSYQVTHFQPFDPVHKRTEATVKGPGNAEFRTSKGAPQAILGLLSEKAGVVKEAVEKAADELASRGYRSLGVARTDEDGEWQYLGILPLYDPPREDSKDTIKAAREMGLKVKMVTGDQVAIGKEIARQIDLGTDILDAQIFAETKHHETGRLIDAIEKADGFAQVFPEHKYQIVDVLQQRGHIVGMTGDGVNDAPALKKADAGIAVSGATDAARAASDIILLTPGLSTIIDAIKESRRIFQRMTSYATYRIAETIRVLIFMALSILVFNFYPVTAVMIVLLAILNDGAILTIAYDRATVSKKPEVWNMHRVLGIATILGVLGVIASFGMFYIGEMVLSLSRETIQTLIYLKLSVAGHLTIFVTRTRGPFWSNRPSNQLLLAVAGTQLAATLITTSGLLMPRISWHLAALVWGYAVVWFLIADRVKIAANRIFDIVN